jgi:hypothetical protein
LPTLLVLEEETQIKVPISVIAMQKRGWSNGVSNGVPHDEELLCFLREMRSAHGWTTSRIGFLDWQLPIRALDLSEEILTNPELGLLVLTSVPLRTAKRPGSGPIHDFSRLIVTLT